MAGASNNENVPMLNEDGTCRVCPKNAEWAKGYVDSLMRKYPDVNAGAIIELSCPSGSNTNTILYYTSNFEVRQFLESFTPHKPEPESEPVRSLHLTSTCSVSCAANGDHNDVACEFCDGRWRPARPVREPGDPCGRHPVPALTLRGTGSASSHGIRLHCRCWWPRALLRPMVCRTTRLCCTVPVHALFTPVSH